MDRPLYNDYVTALLGGVRHVHTRCYRVTIRTDGTIVFRKTDDQGGRRNPHEYRVADYEVKEYRQRVALKNVDWLMLELVPRASGAPTIRTYWDRVEQREEFRKALAGEVRAAEGAARRLLRDCEVQALKQALRQRNGEDYVYDGPCARALRAQNEQRRQHKANLRALLAKSQELCVSEEEAWTFTPGEVSRLGWDAYAEVFGPPK